MMPTYLRRWTANAPQGGQPQRVLVSQGMTRPGIVSGPCWTWRTWRDQRPEDRLPFTRPVPARRPNPALSNPGLR